MNFLKRKELTCRSYRHGEESTNVKQKKKSKYSIELSGGFNKKITQFNNNLSKMLDTHIIGNIPYV